MPDHHEKLDHFTAAILNEAAAESEQVLTSFQEERQKKLADARVQAEAEALSYFRTEVAHIRADAGHQVSRRVQESERALFQRRNQIAEDVFAEVRARIAAYTATPEYGRQLEVLLGEALDALENADDTRIYLRPADRAYIPFLQEAAPQVHLTFLDGAFRLGGLIAESPGCGKRADASFDSRMSELNGHFAELFGISLSDLEA